MKMLVDKIPAVITAYFDKVIVPKAMEQGGSKAFMVSLVGGYLGTSAKSMVDQYVPLAKALGVIDASNRIDIEAAYNHATNALAKAPLTVLGYKVDQGDIDCLRDLMRQHA